MGRFFFVISVISIMIGSNGCRDLIGNIGFRLGEGLGWWRRCVFKGGGDSGFRCSLLLRSR